MSTNQEDYAACKHIKRQQPDFTYDQEVADHIGQNFDLLPLFESALLIKSYTELCSLETNELLKCRWKVYKNVQGRVYKPFQFPDNRDEHFYLSACRFSPSETIYKRLNHRKHLRPGPGVDFKGQIPTPQELHMKRLGSDAKRKYPKKYPKDSKNTKREEKK